MGINNMFNFFSFNKTEEVQDEQNNNEVNKVTSEGVEAEPNETESVGEVRKGTENGTEEESNGEGQEPQQFGEKAHFPVGDGKGIDVTGGDNRRYVDDADGVVDGGNQGKSRADEAKWGSDPRG